MADPAAATITQLKNIQARTGNSIAELHAAVAASSAIKHGKRRAWLVAEFRLGNGGANAVALFIDKPLPDLGGGGPAPAPPTADGDPLDAFYTGAKAVLRPLHDTLLANFRAFGSFEEVPKKSTLSLRRKKQSALVGPATKDSIEIGINAEELPAHAQMKMQPPGSMRNATTRITRAEEIDGPLLGWPQQAFEAAG